MTHLGLHHNTKNHCGATGPICYKDGDAWSVNVIGDEPCDWRYKLQPRDSKCPECDRHMRIARDFNMIMHPNNWPKWPLLPMKRHGDRTPSCGVIVGDPSKFGTVCFLPGAYIFRMPEDTQTRETQIVPALQLLEDGWQVD